MEAFESFVAVALEAEGFVVSEAVKFPVTLQTAKAAYQETQTHGFEIDLVGARSDRLVLATVKSFFGSRGVVSDHVMGTTSNIRARKLYALLNDPLVRRTVIAAAAKRYGYKGTQVQLRLYVGRFAGPKHALVEVPKVHMGQGIDPHHARRPGRLGLVAHLFFISADADQNAHVGAESPHTPAESWARRPWMPGRSTYAPALPGRHCAATNEGAGG